MTAMTFEAVMDNALSLPREQRSSLANRLIESIDEDDASLSPQWKTELRRRLDELESGAVQPLTLEQFRDHLEQRLA